MTVRYVINIWGCYGSNFEAASKKEVLLVILLLLPQNPFMVAEVLVGALQGFAKVSNLPSYPIHSSEKFASSKIAIWAYLKQVSMT